MFGWIMLAVLIGIITSVGVWVHKARRRGEEFGWGVLMDIVTLLILLGACGFFFEAMSESSPSEGAFWYFLILNVLTILAGITLFYKEDAAIKKDKRLKEVDSVLEATGCRNVYSLQGKIEELQRKIEELEHPEWYPEEEPEEDDYEQEE